MEKRSLVGRTFKMARAALPATPPAAKGKVDIRKSPTENLKILAQCLDRAIDELVVVVMKRDLHTELIRVSEMV